MGRLKTIDSFYRRKRDESVVVEDLWVPSCLLELEQQEEEHLLIPLLILELEHQRQEEHLEQQESEHLEWPEGHLEQQEEEEHLEQQTSEPIIFRGIEFLERDPALRPQIWQYPNN